jgi:hypothetical protein
VFLKTGLFEELRRNDKKNEKEKKLGQTKEGLPRKFSQNAPQYARNVNPA